MHQRPLRHTLRLAGIALLGLACMFYPFMPGKHDRLAAALSSMAQALGVTGLLMVPIGILWLADDLTTRRAQRQGSVRRRTRGRGFAFAAMIASTAVAAGVALTALIETGPSLALVVVVLWAYGIRRALAGVRRTDFAADRRVNPTSIYLILVPCILVFARLTVLPAAVDASRKRSIEGSAPFIRAIEAYRAAHGRYPPSLASVHHDYDAPTVGVERYYYEPNGQAYNVFFEQPTYPIGTREFVMYNPRDEHVIIVHNQDLLESPPEQVELERRFHARAARDAGVLRWRYFWFD